MKTVAIGLAAAISLALAAPAWADAPITKTAEKVKLGSKKGKSLFKPILTMGEYEGVAGVAFKSTSGVSGFSEKAKSKIKFQFSGPNLGPVEVACGGGQGKRKILGITYKTEKLQYLCTFSGPGAGPDADFVLVFATTKSLLKALQQPQRNAELRFGGVTLQARTEQVGGAPIGGGKVLGYVYSQDGVDVGAVDLIGDGISVSGAQTVYLPPERSRIRDAAAMLSFILIYFDDPGHQF
jgi:hypothetical protein